MHARVDTENVDVGAIRARATLVMNILQNIMGGRTELCTPKWRCESEYCTVRISYKMRFVSLRDP